MKVFDFDFDFFRVDASRWWLRGHIPNALANSIITLLQDMTAVSLCAVCV
jgi:hypothetical protein